MKQQIIKDKKSLTIKLFVIVWVVLLFHVLLKLTFNYWQPYVIPNHQLQAISDFIDNHSILKLAIDKAFYFVNVVFMLLAGLQQWKFKNNKILIVVLVCTLISAIGNYTSFDTIIDSIVLIFSLICLPLMINVKKWKTILLTFIFSYVFLFLSLWLEGIANCDNMNYVTATFLNIDYYIMLALNYFVFNFIRKGE